MIVRNNLEPCLAERDEKRATATIDTVKSQPYQAPEEQTLTESPSNTVIEKTEQAHSKRVWLWLIILLLAVIVGIWVWKKSPESAPTNPIEKLETPVESENRRTVPILEDNNQ